MAKKTTKKKWVQGVKTVSTFPPADTFTHDAETVAQIMARKEVSPRGLGSAIRMVQYFINRSGRTLSATRSRELEKAKHILQEWSAKEKKTQAKPRQTKKQAATSAPKKANKKSARAK